MFDTSHSWVLLPDGRLRAGWRILLFCAFFVVSVSVFRWAADSFAARLNPAVSIAVSTASFLSAVCVATWLAMSIFEQQPFSAVGLVVSKRSLSQAALGFATGGSLIGAIAGIERALGAIHFEPSGVSPGEAFAALGGITGIIALSACSEEFLFRGYAFQRLIEGTNKSAAIVISSIAFGGVHSWNPHVTRLAVVNTVLAGILLAGTYVKTRALWMPIAFHFSWNWTLVLFGLPISGINLGRMPWRAVPSSSYVWVHGGNYGPEGGMVASGMLLVGIVCVFVCMREAAPTPQEDAGERYQGQG